MKIQEIYGMHLHGEELSALGATETQQMLIKMVEAYPNILNLQRDIKKLNTVRHRHDDGTEFCGDLHRKRIDSVKIELIIESIEAGMSATEAAIKAGISNHTASVLLRANGYKFDVKKNHWKKNGRIITRSFEIDDIIKTD